MNDVKSLQILEARVAKLERSARRWMAGCFAVCVMAVGMGAVANEALKDVEFGVVRAKKFELVDSKGTGIGTFHVKKMDDGNESTVFIATESNKKKAVLITPGDSPVVVNSQ